MKKENKPDKVKSIAREEVVYYQRRIDKGGVTHTISQKTLNEECMTVAESKELLLKKIHNHFHNL